MLGSFISTSTQNVRLFIDDDQNTATSCDIIPFFPSLKVLRIHSCPKLTSMPLFPSLDSELILIRTSSKPLLETMMMAHKEASSRASPSSSFQSLSKLVEMTIVDIDDLQSLPQEGVAYLSSLQSLHIRRCPNLTSLSESIGNLSSLRDLEISNCRKLTSLPEAIGNLSSLRDLDIGNCRKLTSLPEAIGNLSSLQSLVIYECLNLNSLPEAMGNLSSLQSLEIFGCPNLNSLPEGQMLRALMKLSIKRCPMLHQRYNKTSGVDWPKIAHIPNVEFE
nr:disease resistance protein TAO1-like [Ziziphus jujuba var. spinosa]